MASNKKSTNAAFAKRLQAAVDRHPRIPGRNLGQHTYIAAELKKVYGIDFTKQAVGKALNGVTMPRPPVIKALAHMLDMDPALLQFGESSEVSNLDKKKQRIDSIGAVNLVIGMLTLSGGSCAFSEDDDDDVHFRLIMDGKYHDVHVSLGMISKGKVKFTMSPYFEKMLTIGVIKKSPTEFNVYVLDKDSLKDNILKKGAFVEVSANLNEDRILIGSETLEPLLDFSSLKNL